MARLYRSMGLVAGAGAMPFTASVSFLRAPTADSTLTLLALSLPSRALGFAREGERYAAAYVARVQLRQGVTVVRSSTTYWSNDSMWPWSLMPLTR